MRSTFQTSGGFTIFELLVVMLITSVMAYTVLPQFSTLSGTFKRMNAMSFVLQDIKRAQAETITHGCRGILRINSDQESYYFGCDYLAYDSTIPPAPDSTTFARYLPEGVKLSVSDTIIFNSRGEATLYDGTITSLNVSLSQTVGSSADVFATGTLYGTGVFSYD